jgi:AcrR family transcriptional regulator
MFVGVNIGLMVLSASAKRGYHHGDLRNALVEAAATLAKKGGPGSVTVRAAARTVGVTPTAAYRHFAGHEELLAEAKIRCLNGLGEAMRGRLTAPLASGSRQQHAIRNVFAAGRAYIEYALAEPGLFRTAFGAGGAVLDKEPAELTDQSFGLLIGLLDELVAAGVVSTERRPMAEVATWSGVHGLALLLLDGPLRDVAEQTKEEAIDRTLVAVLRGVAEMTPELEIMMAEEINNVR